MNFTCDNCQKRYSIADEKVRGKTVKVRCKNCQNVITVEGPAEEENTRVVSLADVERIRAQERSLAEPEPEPRHAEPEQPWPDEDDEAPDNTYFGDPLPRAQPQAQPQAQVTRRAQQPQAANAAPLDDALFSDLDLPGNRDGGDDEEPQDDDAQYPDDPRAALGGDEDDGKAVQDTRHFAKKSGVTRRNPAWKYAVFALLLLIVPLGLAYVLSETLGVVPLRVQTVDASGNAVEQPVFSAEGVGALRDKLLGRAPPPPPAPPKPPAEGKRPAAAPAGTGAVADAEAAAAPSKGALEAVYVDPDKQDVDPAVRSGEEVAAADTEDVGGPSDEEVERVLAKTQPAFRDCVEAELRKNPSFKGGKVTLTATVGSSGTVTAATLDRKDLNRNSPVGACIRDRAKGMVFSAFAGEAVDLEIPLVLSKSM
ncbi:AgmX/PglI C-terminal domain-containing protein [Myxococcus sp. AM010]|uniref:AgmX/PglI C-terminal domain-containing protein n=1 Tax=Myxococcus sp. AM010 TaxID=2745138 RepID=UPI001595C3CA|nr:AgmX/PglI C-terminal domain-containing protein [Myxococcus sp. AM010]NVJ15947.1 zinc-ribbon domain-containing protein [Myxococcus sp. AM010]